MCPRRGRSPRAGRARGGSAVPAFRYSAWDGTQSGFELDAGAVLEEMSDDLLYHGDLHASLRRLLQQGMRGRDGEQLMGLRDVLERLAARRQELLARHDPSGVLGGIERELAAILERERAGIDRREAEARDAADPGRRDAAGADATRRRDELDRLPPDLAGRFEALRDHDWADPEARASFEELAERLRDQLLESYFRQLSAGMRGLDPDQMGRTKDMLAELNQMLEQRARDEEPDFAGFMERHGDLFPQRPGSLDELLEQMARAMAQMSQLLGSMSAEQRAELQALSDRLLEDLDLRWQMDQLGRNLRDAFPGLAWDRSAGFRGDEPLSLGQVPSVLGALSELDDLEHLLTTASQPGELAEVDPDAVADLLGPDTARALERLAELARVLEEAGLIEQREGRLELTPRGMRAIGQHALDDLFRKLARDRVGRHQLERAGIGHDPAYEHKSYEWGDPFRLDVTATLRNAVHRGGAGSPVRLLPEDFEIERTEASTRSATVLALDVSLSMPMRDNFLPAKKVAMALHSLITTQFPRDYFGLVSFGRVAREVAPRDLPEMSWDFEWGTNLQHALVLARRMLARQTGTKQVILVTDGEPTAHIDGDDAYFEYPPSPVTIAETLKEVRRATREGIRISTFMLDESAYLRAFVERMMQMNRGRAFFTSADALGDYVLVDFLEQRRTHRRAG